MQIQIGWQIKFKWDGKYKYKWDGKYKCIREISKTNQTCSARRSQSSRTSRAGWSLCTQLVGTTSQNGFNLIPHISYLSPIPPKYLWRKNLTTSQSGKLPYLIFVTNTSNISVEENLTTSQNAMVQLIIRDRIRASNLQINGLLWESPRQCKTSTCQIQI